MFRRHYYPILPTLSVILLISGGAAYFFRQHIPWDSFVPKEYQARFMTTTQTISTSVNQAIPEDTTDQISTLSERAQNVSGHVQQVLGESVQVSDEKKPIHEKAYEYAQYQYCLQVVKDYEQSRSGELTPASN
jgi:hypothetical protein